MELVTEMEHKYRARSIFLPSEHRVWLQLPVFPGIIGKTQEALVETKVRFAVDNMTLGKFV